MDGGLGPLARALHALEDRRLLQLEPDVDRDQQQGDRDPERDAPAPVRERARRHRRAADADHEQRQEHPQRRRGLDPGRVVAALGIRRVLRHVSGRGAVFAAEREALRKAETDQDQRSREADGGVGRQEADQHGRHAHHHDGDEEGVFAPDEVADAPEDQGAEGTHEKAGRVRAERAEQRGCLVARREEESREEGGENRVEIEIVPFENGSNGRRDDDPSFCCCVDAGSCSDRHCFGGRAHASSSSGFCVANRGSRRTKRGLLRPQQERTALAKSCRLCSTSLENFSNASDSGLFVALVSPLFLADHLRDCPEGSRECGRRLVARPGQRDLHDFFHGSGTIRHHHHAVGE